MPQPNEFGLIVASLGCLPGKEGTPGFDSVREVLGALGLKLPAEAVRGRGSTPGRRSRRPRISAEACERRQGQGRIWSGRSFGVK